LPAELNPAFARQHPIEDQKREALRGERGFGFLGTANRGDFMAAAGDEPLQTAAAAGMIFDEQNFHLRRSQLT
jgi:hypothetical protein